MRIAPLAICAAVLALASISPQAMAQNPKGIRFWNLTLNTITQLQMAPAGSDVWGPDQCKNGRSRRAATHHRSHTGPLRREVHGQCRPSLHRA